MTAEQAKLLSEALAGSWEADHDVAAGACLQAASELDVVQEAIFNGASDSLVASSLRGISNRLRAAANMAGVLELARDGADEKQEAAT